MSSNCDSDGCPIDHDGNRLEEGVFYSNAPFAVRSDVLHDILSGSGKENDVSHVASDPVDGSRVRSSALPGGIPVVERVDIEDVLEGYSSDEILSPRVERTGNHTSATIQAVLRTTKHERDELIANRRKLQDVLRFLRSQGFKEEDVLLGASSGGFGRGAPIRDEYGLPVMTPLEGTVQAKEKLGEPNPFKDKMKGKIDVSGGEVPSVGVKDMNDAKASQDKSNVTPPEEKKSWANILQNEHTAEAKFEYFPLGKDVNVVEPPIEALRQGNDKFRCCVVGTFTKGTKSYKEVADFAFKMWGSRGLLKVFQKDPQTYVLKFDNERNRDAVIARGTWYVGRRPMVVTCWGIKPGKDNISTIPLWIKLSNIPDSYWTADGLSRLSSVVGKPLGADDLTAKLELLPFARMQVLYRLGDPLPEDISAVVLDPITEEKSVVKVSISYPFRPMFCSGCNSLGHTVGACPKVTRIWVKKDTPKNDPNVSSPAAKSNVNLETGGSKVPISADIQSTEEPWTEVRKRKDSSPSSLSNQEASASPPRNFRNLKNVDEVDKRIGTQRLTKSQKKKLRLQKGSSSPISNS